MLQRVVFAAVSAIALAASANAADMYPAPEGPYSLKDGPYLPSPAWTGFYVGVNGGYAWSSSSDQFSYPANNNGRSSISAFGGIDPSGGFGGGQIGYNWQGGYGCPHLVLGVEADIQGGDISDSATDAQSIAWKSQVDWFGTVRGRVGYAFDSTLLYATGGFAYGNVDNSATTAATRLGPSITFRSDGIATGYVAGGGAEHKVSPAWSIKAEYQYINLGENDPRYSGISIKHAIPGIKVDDNDFHTVRLGLNYHIHQQYEPLK